MTTQFALWFYYGMLQSMDWPRKQGLMRRQIVNGLIADITAKQLGDLGRLIGAGIPEVGVKLLAHGLENRDWSVQPPSELPEWLNSKHAEGWEPLVEVGTNVPWKIMIHESVRASVVLWFLAELWHGLTNSQAVLSAADEELRGRKQSARDAARYGLAVDPQQLAETSAEAVAQAQEALREYEQECGLLPPPPAVLARYMTALRADA